MGKDAPGAISGGGYPYAMETFLTVEVTFLAIDSWLILAFTIV